LTNADRLVRVANIYNATHAIGGYPTVAVRDEFPQLSRRQVSRLVAECKELGLIPKKRGDR
jgi:hypothetical protein